MGYFNLAKPQATWSWTEPLEHPSHLTFTNTEDILCYRTWMTYYTSAQQHYRTASWLYRHRVTTDTATFHYKTIESFGSSQIRTLCDSIPRLQLYAPITESRTSTVAVTRSYVSTIWQPVGEPVGVEGEKPLPPTCQLPRDVCNGMARERLCSIGLKSS
jgi:hypothetical protein